MAEGGGMALSSFVGSGLSGVAAWLVGVLRVGEAARLRDERSPCRLGIMACCKAFFCELCVTSMLFWFFGAGEVMRGLLRVLGLRQNWRAGGPEIG